MCMQVERERERERRNLHLCVNYLEGLTELTKPGSEFQGFGPATKKTRVPCAVSVRGRIRSRSLIELSTCHHQIMKYSFIEKQRDVTTASSLQ